MIAASAWFLIADDHPLLRGALAEVMAGVVPSSRIVEAGDLDSARRFLTERRNIDLVLLDLAMPGMRGFSGLIYLIAEHPNVPIVVVSAHEDRFIIRRCISFGASGFLPKTMDSQAMCTAIRKVLAGEIWTPPDVDLGIPEDQEIVDLARRMASLTPQQARVLTRICEGLLNKQIAYELSLSEATVKAHVGGILNKLGVESRTQAVISVARVESLLEAPALRINE